MFKSSYWLKKIRTYVRLYLLSTCHAVNYLDITQIITCYKLPDIDCTVYNALLKQTVRYFVDRHMTHM
jgi:hypothetical protein